MTALHTLGILSTSFTMWKIVQIKTNTPQHQLFRGDCVYEQWTLDWWKAVLWSGVQMWDFWFQLLCLCQTHCGWMDDLLMCSSHRKAWRRRCGGALLVALIHLEFNAQHSAVIVGLSAKNNHPTSPQLRWFGMSWTAEWRKSSQQVLSICGNSKTVGKVFQGRPVERMPRMCKAVMKAKGGYFEESKIYFDLFNTFGYYMIPYVLFHSVDVFTIILQRRKY